MTIFLTMVLLKVPLFIQVVGYGMVLLMAGIFIFTKDNSCLLAKLIRVASIGGLIAGIAIAGEADSDFLVVIVLVAIINVIFSFGFAEIVDAAHKYLNKDA